MFKSIIIGISIIALQAVAAISIKAPHLLEKRNLASAIMDTFLSAFRILDEASTLPPASHVFRFDRNSRVVKEAIYYSNLCRASNCRASLDKWDCENCQSTLPDGVVIRAFQTYPMGVTGEVVTSEEKKVIYVIIRGASSVRSKILFFDHEFANHPMIPGAKVQIGSLNALFDIRDIVYRTVSDQLIVHPDYKVYVVGHSFGSGVGSLLLVDLFQRLPINNARDLRGYLFGKPRIGNAEYAKYVSDNRISIKRYVEENDDIVHHPYLNKGYVHEGDEYWLKSVDDFAVYVCLGPTETRSCSSSLNNTDATPHVNYFGIKQDCPSNVFNIF